MCNGLGIVDGQLVVEYKKGARYRYEDSIVSTDQPLCCMAAQAESVGKFVNGYIKILPTHRIS